MPLLESLVSVTAFAEDDFVLRPWPVKGAPLPEGGKASAAVTWRGGAVWALLLFLTQREGNLDCLKSRLIVRGGTELGAVRAVTRKTPGRGRRQGAWADRPMIFERNIFKKVT